LLAAPVAFAQAPNDPVVAAEVAVRRQEQLIKAREKLAMARVAEARREILYASQQYNTALELVQGIGAMGDLERSEAISGLSRTTLMLADQAIGRGNFVEAKLHIDRVLKVDPTNELAQKMRQQNDRLAEENKGKVPHPEAEEYLARADSNHVEAARFVQDGKLYYETGNLREAEEVLRRAVKMEPDNKGAHYFLDLVIARKYAAEARLREVNSKQLLMEVEQAWSEPVKRSALDVPNAYARTNLVFASDKRQEIYRKLRNTRLTEWGPIDNLPLSEVIRSMADEIRKRDIGGKGINFMISGNADAGAGGGAGAVDAAGLPVVADPGAGDLNAVTIRLGTKLVDLSVEDILNILEKIADRKIKYSVEDFGIIISPRAVEPTPLHTRYFHVDPNTFQQGLANVVAFSFGESQGGGGGGGGRGGGGRGGGGRGGGGRGNQGGGNFGGNQGGGQGQGQGGGATYAQVSIAGGQQGAGGRQGGAGAAAGAAGAGAAQPGGGGINFLTTVTPSEIVIPVVRSFFATAGVSLVEPGKAVFYNDRLGILMVRATLSDLDTIEKAMQILNMSPPQMTIRAKFMEVNQDDNRALGFDWYLGNVGSGSIVGQGGTAPTLAGQPTVVGNRTVGGPFPNASIPTPPALTDELVTSGLRNSAPALATVTGILTDPQFRVVVRALEQRGASDLLSAPEVTTMSGRQAQIKVVDIQYIVTELDTDQTAAGQTATVVGGAAGGGGVGSLIVPIAEPFELGPVLDVVPYVNADGYTIQMTLLPTLKEFLGYDDPGAFVAQVQGASAGGASPNALTEPTPLPKFRLRQVATTAMVWDGQTIVLGGLISEKVQKQKDKIPVLGDLPFFGRFFRSESNTSSKKNLVIFVTPRLIDPAGNPLHSEEEMPFAQHSTPTARTVTQ
jgi:type II secretory pathway component GspD/PulD (secretin)/tetratricopeptide (TPR) repeat protein